MHRSSVRSSKTLCVTWHTAIEFGNVHPSVVLQRAVTNFSEGSSLPADGLEPVPPLSAYSLEPSVTYMQLYLKACFDLFGYHRVLEPLWCVICCAQLVLFLVRSLVCAVCPFVPELPVALTEGHASTCMGPHMKWHVSGIRQQVEWNSILQCNIATEFKPNGHCYVQVSRSPCWWCCWCPETETSSFYWAHLRLIMS
jgi:hypothetical protein